MLSRLFIAALWSPEREMADLLALVCDVYCNFVNFPFGILQRLWYLIVTIPDPCCLSYIESKKAIISIKAIFSPLISEFIAL